jgi:hypothetical protein
MSPSELWQTGQVLGTPGYMPPEQARGRAKGFSPTLDVYGLGAVLYCLLTGRPPFQAADALETMRQVCHDEPASPRQLNPAVPRDLEAVCLKSLRKIPGDRYASAQELADDLGRWLAGEPVRVRPPSLWRRLDRWVGRFPELGLLGLVFLGGGTVICVALIASWQLAAVILTVALAGYSATRSGAWVAAVGAAGSMVALLLLTVLLNMDRWPDLQSFLFPLALATPTLLAALASAWWRSHRVLKMIVLAGFLILVLIIIGRLESGVGLSYVSLGLAGRLDVSVSLAYVALGVFGIFACMRALTSYFAASFVSVALGLLCGGIFGGLFGAIPGAAIWALKLSRPLREAEIVGVIVVWGLAGSLIGAIIGAARRSGARTDFGIYPNPGLTPAVEIPAFKGPALRFSAPQLRALADLLDRHGQTLRVRPLLSRQTENASPPSPSPRENREPSAACVDLEWLLKQPQRAD